MTDDQKNELEYKVRWFLKQQEMYRLYSDQAIEAVEDGPGIIGVIFGSDIQSGIAGFGSSVDEAYEDFLVNWDRYKGFEWLNKHL